MATNKEVGVITEQGFVAGVGLGFNPLQENEKKAIDEQNKKKDSEKEKKDNSK